MNAEQLRHHLIDVLAVADAPMTTSALLAELTARNTSRTHPIVVEQVYRGLRALAGKGVVRRVHDSQAAPPTGRRPGSPANRKDPYR